MGDAANECVLVGDLGVHRQQFADFDTRHVGTNRRELPPIVLGWTIDVFQMFEAAKGFYVVCCPKRKRPGKGFSGFEKALAKLPLPVLRALADALRGRMQALFDRRLFCHGFKRIHSLVDREPWAKQEYERLTTQAAGGDGYAAAFLYALERDGKYIPAATKHLTMTLEIHAPVPAMRRDLGEHRHLFEHWSDRTNAEQMNHWLDVLLRNHRLLREIVA